MAFMTLGSKSDAFHLQGQTWICANGLQSDVTVQIGEISFNLHKFPLLSRSGFLEKMIAEVSDMDVSAPVLTLDDIPGGHKVFELITRFCYGVKMELTCFNIVSLRCAAEFLRMTEDYGEGNLILQTENFLNDQVLSNWTDTLKTLEMCEEVASYAEDLHIVSRCIDSLAMKACADSKSITNLQNSAVIEGNNPDVWNGISVSSKPECDNWWFEEISLLNLSLYKQFILAIQSRGMKPETIAASLMHYATKYLPLLNNGKTVSFPSEADQRIILEEIATLLPYKKGVTSPKFLFGLLRSAMVLNASPVCRENLEKRVGAELDQALLADLLIPNIGYSVDTLYDIDCVQRILEHFMSLQQETIFSPCIVEEGQFLGGADTLTPITMVASLMDGFLAEIAQDVNLKLPKFEVLAATIPDYARPVDDGVYHAVDIYLKAHPWLTDIEREQLCRLMNCQKLSLEASTHAAQNERLPLRVIVQVLFFEQLRLRTSVSGWFFVSQNLENPQNPNGNSTAISQKDNHIASVDVKDRVSALEQECSSMKEEIHKLMKSKKRWKLFSKRFSFRQKLHPCNSRKSCHLKDMDGQQNHKNNADIAQ